MRKIAGAVIIVATLLALASCNADKNLDIVKDVDGNIYSVVTIGQQKWLQQNLKVTHYNNGDPIANDTAAPDWTNSTTGAYCSFNNIDTNARQLGRLYNWYAVNDPRQLCPAGWHVPGDTEWHALALALDTAAQWVADAAESFTAGGELKSVTLWQPPNTGASNATGFAAPGGGYRFVSGRFGFIGSYGFFWTSTGSGLEYAWCRLLFWDNAYISRNTTAPQNGFSVRCVKN
jgi:uncharacterized protein (TIGR02145 family)